MLSVIVILLFRPRPTQSSAVWSQSKHACDRRSDGQTDRQTELRLPRLR